MGVISGYRSAVVVGAIGLASLLWALLGPPYPQPFGLLLAAASLPLAVLLAVWGRLKGTLPSRAGVGGAVIGVAVALLSHGLVLAFGFAFFLGFAEQGVALLESLRLDPKVTTVLSSTWTILLLVELVVVAPFTEEAGKALGALMSHPTKRGEAFLAGVAAGTGFAVVENLLYATGGVFFGEPWTAILLARSLGAAVHPLATGMVMLGWWEWRHGEGLAALARRFLAGAGIHALWNGSLVVLAVTETAYEVSGTTSTFAAVSLVYSGALGAILAAGLWQLSRSISAGRDHLAAFDLSDVRTLGAWTVLACSILLPVAMLILAFPDFYGG